MNDNSATGRLVRPKMSDIARLVGVSPATVSRALAGSSLVAAETRQRVEEAVRATGYVVNHVASGLRRQRSRQILVVLPDIANPFFTEVILGIEEEAQAQGFGVLVGNTAGAREREDRLARQLLTGAVDGLILLTGRRPRLPAGVDASRMIAVSERIPRCAIATVTIDNVAGARQATEHLLALGHQRIGHIGGPPANILTGERLQGYKDALTAAGIVTDAALIAHGDFSFASGRAAMRRLLSLPQPPTAVFCSNDEMAIGAMRAAREAGIAVPADLSLVGFDDIPFAGFCDPALTTLLQPRRDLGRRAAGLLLNALAGRQAPRGAVILPHELVLRETTAAPHAVS
jgi:LacI family repressor for deo operon, udp, cdd, tsx, nupC, and nupG